MVSHTVYSRLVGDASLLEQWRVNEADASEATFPKAVFPTAIAVRTKRASYARIDNG